MSEVTTTDGAKVMGLTARLKTYFGLKPSQGLTDFGAEVRALPDDYKAWFVDEFNKMGLPTTK